MDVLAAWSEPFDDAVQSTWQVLECSGHVTKMGIEPKFDHHLNIPAGGRGLLARMGMVHE